MEKRISGYTGLMGLFGSPIGHSASPEMYNFCFQHDGLDYAYLAFDVKAEDMPETINTIRLLKMRGGNFTMPCKNIAAKLMDHLSPAAQLVGACNAFVNEEGVLTGYITDGIGFCEKFKRAWSGSQREKDPGFRRRRRRHSYPGPACPGRNGRDPYFQPAG